MQVVITPYYQDLFPGGNDTLEGLLGDIPTASLVPVVALMDAELYSKDEGHETQLKLFDPPLV